MSQVLTLYTTPVVYLYLENIRVRFNRRRGHTVADEVVPAGPMSDAGFPARHSSHQSLRRRLARPYVLKSAVAPSEYAVARPKPGDAFADRLEAASHLHRLEHVVWRVESGLNRQPAARPCTASLAARASPARCRSNRL